MASLGSSDDINDLAAEWAVEAAYGELSSEARGRLEAWLAADRRHRGAFVRARALLRASEDAVIQACAEPGAPASPATTYNSDNDNDVRPGFLSRWKGRLTAGGAAVAAGVAVIMMVGMPARTPLAIQDVAQAGRVIALSDGSTAALGPNARIEAAMSGTTRRITLLQGEAIFTVAKDKARPFVVRSGEAYAQATGTVYSVGRVGRYGGTVRVKEGSVLVWLSDERDQAVLLRAGGALTLDPGRPQKPETLTRPKSPSPDEAQISLDNVPVTVAVARFNRSNSTKIVVTDPAIAETEIIGLYNVNDPKQFAQSVASITDSRLDYTEGKIAIKPK